MKSSEKNLFAMLGEIRIEVGDGFNALGKSDEVEIFLDVLFGKKRLLIIWVDGNKRAVEKALSEYCLQKNLEKKYIDGRTLTADKIKGEAEIVYDKTGFPQYNQKTPDYISGNKQMIIVKNLNSDTDIEVIRAFCYMGFLNSYYNDIENLPDDKLPYGSGYVFLADEGFPRMKFESFGHLSQEFGSLNMKNFQRKVIEHMSKYRIENLGIKEKGTSKFKGNEKEYEHILAKTKQKYNILPKYREEFFSSQYYKLIKLHRDFHHLNSSQAMCINFFYPLIVEKKLDVIFNLLQIKAVPDYNNVSFEKVSDMEKLSEVKTKGNTNFDFFIQSTEEIKIYFEIKYTENEFGKTVKNDTHRHKFKGTYDPQLSKNPAIFEHLKNEDFFLENYQIMRNLIHIDENSYVVFIYPENNKAIRNEALAVKRDIIKMDWKEHFILFTWEEIVDQIQLWTKSQKLNDYYNNEFILKYLKL